MRTILALSILLLFKGHVFGQYDKYIIPDQYIVEINPNIIVPIMKQQKGSLDPAKRDQKFLANEPNRIKNKEAITKIIESAGIKTDQVTDYYTEFFSGFSATLSSEQVKRLISNSSVKGVYNDKFCPAESIEENNEVPVGDLGNGFVPSPVIYVGGPLAYNKNTGTWIWILDSGIDLDHPDLNVIRDSRYAKGMDGLPPDDLKYGHGTKVAGAAAAKYNSFGTTGVSAGAPVVPVAVCCVENFIGGGFGAREGTILAGLNHICGNNVAGDVVNISLFKLVGPGCDTMSGTTALIREAITLLGLEHTWVCICAGNDEAFTGTACNSAEQSMPGCVNGYKIYTVGANNLDNSCANVSYWGANVDWAIPDRITTTATNKTGSQQGTGYLGKYTNAEGTSLSTPILAGLLHALDTFPAAGGSSTCCNRKIKTPTASRTLGALRFDVELELVEFRVSNVRDLDNTEDLYGSLSFFSGKHFLGNLTTQETSLFEKSRENANNNNFTNGTRAINKRIRIATDLTYPQLLSTKIVVGGQLTDAELFGGLVFKCNECEYAIGEEVGKRTLDFSRMPSTVSSIQALAANGTFQDLRFASDRFFELNFYENGNSNDGWCKTMWKVWVRPH